MLQMSECDDVGPARMVLTQCCDRTLPLFYILGVAEVQARSSISAEVKARDWDPPPRHKFWNDFVPPACIESSGAVGWNELNQSRWR